MDTPTRLHDLTHASGTYKPTLHFRGIPLKMTDGGPLLSQLLTGLNVNALYCDGSFFNASDGSAFFPEPTGEGQFWFRNCQCVDTGNSLILYTSTSRSKSLCQRCFGGPIKVFARPRLFARELWIAQTVRRHEGARLARITSNAALWILHNHPKERGRIPASALDI